MGDVGRCQGVPSREKTHSSLPKACSVLHCLFLQRLFILPFPLLTLHGAHPLPQLAVLLLCDSLCANVTVTRPLCECDSDTAACLFFVPPNPSQPTPGKSRIPNQEGGSAEGTRFLQGWMVRKSLLSGFEVVLRRFLPKICCLPQQLWEQDGERRIRPFPLSGLVLRGWAIPETCPQRESCNPAF